MPKEPEIWVIDTSALFTLKQDEPGAGQVEKILRTAGPRGNVYISFMSLMEFFYVLEKTEGESRARQGYLELRQLPIKAIESDEELALAAANIKASAPLSVADAWVAATAQRLGAKLVHKDPEFEPLKEQISLINLPYKNK